MTLTDKSQTSSPPPQSSLREYYTSVNSVNIHCNKSIININCTETNNLDNYSKISQIRQYFTFLYKNKLKLLCKNVFGIEIKWDWKTGTPAEGDRDKS